MWVAHHSLAWDPIRQNPHYTQRKSYFLDSNTSSLSNSTLKVDLVNSYLVVKYCDQKQPVKETRLESIIAGTRGSK